MRLKAYLPFTSAGIQSAMAYKWNFLGFFFGEIFFTFVMYYLWKAVFVNTPGGIISGFSLLDMTVYIFVANITGFLAGTDASYAVGEEIIEGTISMRMIKPVSFNLSLLFTELGGKLITVLLILLPIFTGLEIFRYIQTGIIHFSPVNLGLYLVSTALSYLVMFFFDLCFGFLAFVLKNLWGFNLLKFGILNFLSGGMIPLIFFPLWARTVMDFLPFASMRYTPVMIYTGMFEGFRIVEALAIQLFWIGALYLLSSLIWRFTIRHLTVQGG